MYFVSATDPTRSLRTNNHTLPSHLRLCSLLVASYGSQGLRWRYSNPPPHGVMPTTEPWDQFPRWRRSSRRLSVCSVLRCPDLWLQCSVSFVHGLKKTQHTKIMPMKMFFRQTFYLIANRITRVYIFKRLQLLQPIAVPTWNSLSFICQYHNT
jgi:hypothetical protein